MAKQSNSNTTKNVTSTKQAKGGKPTAAPEASAKPGTKDDAGTAEKPKKVKKVRYPGLEKGEDGKVNRLKEWPADWDPKKHKPLRRVDFENEAVWFLKRAEDYEEKAADMRKQAELAEKLGNSQDRAKAKRLAKMQDQMAKIQAELKEQGINVEELLATVAGTGDEK